MGKKKGKMDGKKATIYTLSEFLRSIPDISTQRAKNQEDGAENRQCHQQDIAPQNQQHGVPQNQQHGVSENQQHGVPQNQQHGVPQNQHHGVPQNQQDEVPQNQQHGVPENQQHGVPENQQHGVPENQQHGVPQNQENHQEDEVPEIQPDNLVPENQQDVVPVNQQDGVPHNQQHAVPENQQHGVPQNQQRGVPQNQQHGVPENQQHGVPQNQENHQEDGVAAHNQPGHDQHGVAAHNQPEDDQDGLAPEDQPEHDQDGLAPKNQPEHDQDGLAPEDQPEHDQVAAVNQQQAILVSAELSIPDDGQETKQDNLVSEYRLEIDCWNFPVAFKELTPNSIRLYRETNPPTEVIPLPKLNYTWYVEAPHVSSSKHQEMIKRAALAVCDCQSCTNPAGWVKISELQSCVPEVANIGYRLRLNVEADGYSNASRDFDTNTVVYPQDRYRIYSPGINFELIPGEVRVLTYNILAQNLSLINGGIIYSYCSAWAFNWDSRKNALLKEILDYDADIICLQEVQEIDFNTFFRPQLEARGYEGLYKRKRAGDTKTQREVDGRAIWGSSNDGIWGSANDGCATFYRKALFKEIKKLEIEFWQSADEVINKLPHGDTKIRKDNVALAVILEIIQNEGGSQRRICVANTHIHAHVRNESTKLFQVVDLINKLEKFNESKDPMLICGDFNILPLSEPYKFITEGILPTDQPSYLLKHHQCSHSGLASAYSSFFRSYVEDKNMLPANMDPESEEPMFTTWTSIFRGTLDYIFYTDETRKLIGVLEPVGFEDVLDGLPSDRWPSDHVALMASFLLM